MESKKKWLTLSPTQLKSEISERVTIIAERNHTINSLSTDNVRTNNELRVLVSLLNKPRKDNEEGLDYSTWNFDGVMLRKTPFVVAVAKTFLNNKMKWSEIKKLFPDQLGVNQNEDGSVTGEATYGIFKEVELARKIQTSGQRYTDFETPLVSKDGVKFVVCTQWSVKNFFRFLRVVHEHFKVELKCSRLTPKGMHFVKLNKLPIVEV